MSDEREYLRWVDIEHLAIPLFWIWTEHPELQWARAAWERLEAKGLTRAPDQVQRAVVLVRLIALAGLFHGFAAVAWQEGDVQPQSWADELELPRTRLLQFLGREFDAEFSWDDDRLLESAFDEVHSAEYEKVVAVVIEGFGGIHGAFVSLWLSSNPDWAGRTDVPAEMFSGVVNAPSGAKLAAYDWLSEQAAGSRLTPP